MISSKAPQLKPLKSGLLAAQVAQTLRQAIFSGQFPPGGQILESHVARQLGVSQTTVREALGQLDQVGLVVRIPNKGSFVNSLSPGEVRDRLRIRILLEGMAWEAAAQTMGTDEFDELESRLLTVRSAAESKDYPRMSDAELDFHRYIWLHAGNPTLALMLEQLCAPLFAFITLERAARQIEEPNPYARHKLVVDVLRTGDAAAAGQALRDHLRPSYSPVEASIEE